MPAPARAAVRPARRPAGWVAPGPPPRVPADRPDLWPAAGEELCHLAGDWRLLQRPGGHRWSLDDLVTAWRAAEAAAAPGAGAPARVADLGCGIGAVLLLLAWRFPGARCLGVEAQAGSVALARRSVAWNGVGDRVMVRRGDLRAPLAAAGGPFDLVTGTPPYLPPGTATPSPTVERARCHVELHGGVEDYCAAAARLLAPEGRFVTCAGGTQRARVLAAAAAAGLAVLACRDVVPRAGKAPLFGVYVMRHAARAAPDRRGAPARVAGGSADAPPAQGPPPLPVEPPLVVRDAAGAWTDDFRAVRRAMGMPV